MSVLTKLNYKWKIISELGLELTRYTIHLEFYSKQKSATVGFIILYCIDLLIQEFVIRKRHDYVWKSKYKGDNFAYFCNLFTSRNWKLELTVCIWSIKSVLFCPYLFSQAHTYIEMEMLALWGIFSCNQAALWMVQSVHPSVRPSIHLSNLFHYVPIIVSSWSFQQWQKWDLCKRSEVKGQGHRGQNPL